MDFPDFHIFCLSEVHLARYKEAAKKAESFPLRVSCSV